MKLINKIILLNFFLMFLSCDSNKLRDLNLKFQKLSLENKQLKDSLSKIDYYKIKSSQMILIAEEKKDSSIFYGMMVNRSKNIPFNLYQLDTLHYAKNVKRELISEKYGNSQFEIKANPKYIKNRTLYLLAEYDLDSLKIQIPGVLNLR